MLVLGVIPARGGSKGVPGKNVALVGGKPLIVWTIETARAARTLDRLVVSTDSPAIADVAAAHGAETPFLRPSELAKDDTPGIDPILHAVRWLEEREGYRPDIVVALQPTSPLRTAADIDAAVALCGSHEVEAVVSVTPAGQHPYWMKRIDEWGYLHDLDSLEPTGSVLRRQDLPLVYALNGAIYLARRDLLLRRRTWYGDRTRAYVMPPGRSLDIDTPWDLHLADLLLSDRSGRP